MTEIIRINLGLRWEYPVRVMAADERIDTIVGPGDALALLVTRWKNHKGPSYKIARKSCRDALRGRVGTALSRAHFITACIDAGILE